MGKIGVVGGGAGGVSTCKFLDQFFENQKTKIQVDLFERENRLGGRNQHQSFVGLDSEVEIGGSVYHVQNYNVRNWALSFNLSESKMSEDGHLAVWNGKEFAFWESDWKILSYANILWRYGLSPVTVKNLALQVKDQFLKIYSLLNKVDENGKKNTFETPQEMFEALGLERLHRISLEDYLIEEKSGVSRKFLDELATVVTKINYGQNTSISALAGFICFIGSGEQIVSVREGIATIWQKLIKTTKTAVHLDTQISFIDYESDSDGNFFYRVKLLKNGNEEERKYDSIVISTPLEFSNIQFGKGIQLKAQVNQNRPYQKTFVTLLVGTINPLYFGLESSSVVPEIIGSTEGEGIVWRSIAVKAAGRNVTVFKIFSEEEMDDSLLDQIFTKRRETSRFVWNAYPMLYPTSLPAPPFSLDGKGLYYVNGMESYISVIEGETLAGQNIAQLIFNKFA